MTDPPGVANRAPRRRRQQGNRPPPNALARVQNANLAPVPDKDFKYIADLFQRATTIITGAECTAWGLLGGVFGYCVAHTLALGLLGSGVGMPLGFIAGVAIYTLVNPTQKQLLKCLELAKITFASNQVSKKEFETLRAKCFKAHG